MCLSLNVTPANLVDVDFAGRVIGAVACRKVRPRSLEMQVTETAFMEQHIEARVDLETIATAGIRLTIDDFGTGDSSLSYLRNLPAQLVKIDNSFIHDRHGPPHRGTCSHHDPHVALARRPSGGGGR